jgi:tetratricopeptide (TPR) repeat protein
LRGAIDDLERGEAARATVALQSVLRSQPGQPDAHWYLGLLARQRGRYEQSEAHLRQFLASAGDAHAAQRVAAERKLQQLEDERRLADETELGRTASWIGVEHPHFRVYYDAALGTSSPGYAERVLNYLGAAYREVGRRLGSVPEEPLGVMLYGKAAYLRAHRHRFSFQTVGFFDGRIHVVSAAHPAGDLRALLFHEYTHAVFREQTGGDRPFWLNEGMAELSERSSRQQAGLTRGERSVLRRRMDAGLWIPLRRIAPSFAGLDDDDARAAYLQSTAAAEWIVARTTSEQRGAILAKLDAGMSDDAALRAGLSLDTAAVDAGVQEWVRGEFAPAQRDR